MMKRRSLNACLRTRIFPSKTERGKCNFNTGQVICRVYLTFPDSSAGKESACNAGDPGSIPGLEISPWRTIGYPLQYSCLENPQGQRSLVGNSPWGHTESDMTEQLSTEHIFEKFLMLHSAVHTLTK